MALPEQTWLIASGQACWNEQDEYGVYRLVAAPSSPLDMLCASWLSTNPEYLAPDSISSLRQDAVVASAAAAMVHGIGGVYPAPYRTIVASRR